LVLFATGILVGSQVFDHLKDSVGSHSLESVHGFDLVDAASTHGGSMVAVVAGANVDDATCGGPSR